jgi:hypothetical protein
MKALKINSSLFYQLNGKTIKHKVVVLEGIGDIYPLAFKHDFQAEVVFVNNCDKNFVYYYANKGSFPNMKTLYLMSHPCEPYTLRQKVERI